VTLDLAPHLDETIERAIGADLPCRSIDRYRPTSRVTPDFLAASGPPFSTHFADRALDLWRFAGGLLVRTPASLWALDREDKLVELPVEPEAAERFLRWPEAYAQPERAALLISAWLDLIPLLDQREVESVSAPAMALMAFAPPRLLEAWRAPAREGDELVFFAASDPVRARNVVHRVRADLANRWLELEELCEGWHRPPAPGETDDPFERDPGFSANPVADPRYDPGNFATVNPVRDPTLGLWGRLRRMFRGR
jgi:hypothetical protein